MPQSLIHYPSFRVWPASIYLATANQTVWRSDYARDAKPSLTTAKKTNGSMPSCLTMLNTLPARIIFPNRRNMASWSDRCREGFGLRYLEGPDDHDLSSR
jgi:hypothetical protein